jgi:hypothetical protein
MQGQMMSATNCNRCWTSCRLMEEGKTAEAAELMEQLRQLMQNMQVVEGPGGQGQGQAGPARMRDLGETLRDQQELSDDAFRDLQGVPRPGEELGDGQRAGTRPGTGRRHRHASTAMAQAMTARLPIASANCAKSWTSFRTASFPATAPNPGEEGRRNLDRSRRRHGRGRRRAARRRP